MTLEERIAALERENQIFREIVQETLVALQDVVLQDAAPPAADRWRRRAWVVALLNLLLAITLFVNVRFFTLDGLPSTLDPQAILGLRALWIALAFIWLLLQLYPLALLFESEETPSGGQPWRAAMRLLTSSPAMMISVTGFVLLLTLVSVLWPTGWLWLMGIVAVCVVSTGIRSTLPWQRNRNKPE